MGAVLVTLCLMMLPGSVVQIPAPQTPDAPLFIDATGAPNGRATEALAVIAEAAGHGLDPASYRFSQVAFAGPDFETELNRALLRYLRDLQRGRVDPRSLGLDLPAPAEDPNLPATVREAVVTGRLHDLARDLAPSSRQYDALRAALSRYRSLAADPTLPPLPALDDRAVHPGDPLAGAGALHARLIALGDIPPGALPSSDGVYDPALVAGVTRFQERHGLEVDGIIGRRTVAALQVPLTWRVRQIELALERVRWLPRESQGPTLAVNIAMFHLWGTEALPPNDAAELTMKVIAGCAERSETPVFAADLDRVIFRPYWNVPRSIIHGEILPRIKRDPGYLARNGFEIVRGESDQGAVVPPTPEAISQLAQGALRLRQRPGQGNALGLIKFDFPNRYSVYLHGTPAVDLFSRAQRDLSHGCVRVEDPVSLAQWALNDPAWSAEAIRNATLGADSRPVSLARPIRVVLFYSTAMVTPEGTLHFATDLYGHDGPLDRALLFLAPHGNLAVADGRWKRSDDFPIALDARVKIGNAKAQCPRERGQQPDGLPLTSCQGLVKLLNSADVRFVVRVRDARLLHVVPHPGRRVVNDDHRTSGFA
ncbi:MAG: L,D-transpeptidase family protein [Acidobacteria bacterium]|nr:L,D-transpeptidase family protein [Acidobacteriota bacterium]